MKFYIFLRFWDALLEKFHLIKDIAFLSLMIAQESGLTMTHTIWEKYSTNWSYAICLWIVIRIGYPPQEHLSPFPASIFRATESLSPGSWFCFSLLACLFKSHFKFIQLWACEPTSNQDTMVRFIVLHCSVSLTSKCGFVATPLFKSSQLVKRVSNEDLRNHPFGTMLSQVLAVHAWWPEFDCQHQC